MSTSTSSTTEMIRRGLLKIDDATVLATVDSLNLRGNNKIQAVVGMPLRTLQQRRDVTTFASSAPIAAVKGILELLALAPLEQVVEALGDHADSPSYDQLNAAVDQLLANGATNDDIVALLTFAIGEEFPAAAHCRRLLEERAEFQLPQLPEVAAPDGHDWRAVAPARHSARRTEPFPWEKERYILRIAPSPGPCPCPRYGWSS